LAAWPPGVSAATAPAPTVADTGAPDGDGEPSVEELQRAAVRLAGLEPQRARSLGRRVRLAALAPQVRVRVGQGLNALQTTTDSDGATKIVVGDRSAWTWEVAATWSLDRLVFNPEEPRLLREAQRAAARREGLVADVAHLYYARKRLMRALGRGRPPDGMEPDEARLALDELTATLDGLTGGALRAGAAP
jgi:hypothetical protein